MIPGAGTEHEYYVNANYINVSKRNSLYLKEIYQLYIFLFDIDIS